MREDEVFSDVVIHVIGKHNILNAVAAAAAAYAAGCTPEDVRRGLDEFQGVGRRFERLGKIGGGCTGADVADDYAHHPAEVAATLDAAKELGYNRVIAVHQPFTYSRTLSLMDDFAEALRKADKVILTEIMGSREKNTQGVYAAHLAEKIPKCEWFATFEEVAARVREEAQDGDLILTMGCGDVYKVARMLTAHEK